MVQRRERLVYRTYHLPVYDPQMRSRGCVGSALQQGAVSSDPKFLSVLPQLRQLGGNCPKVDSYLVDPASSHMLVSKIKPCMSKYKPH